MNGHAAIRELSHFIKIDVVPSYKSISDNSCSDNTRSESDEQRQRMKWLDRNNCLARAEHDQPYREGYLTTSQYFSPPRTEELRQRETPTCSAETRKAAFLLAHSRLVLLAFNLSGLLTSIIQSFLRINFLLKVKKGRTMSTTLNVRRLSCIQFIKLKAAMN
jgi:hypothetical protein